MQLTVTFDVEPLIISKLSEEAESNESVFIKNLCSEILQQFAFKTKDVFESAKKMNLENPYGFPNL